MVQHLKTGSVPLRIRKETKGSLTKFRTHSRESYDEVINRLKGVDKKDQAKEGIKICVETIQRLKEMKGIAGVHVMAIEWEERVPEIVETAGLLPRPVVE